MTPERNLMINKKTIKLFKRGTMLINTSRGALTEPSALVEAIEQSFLGTLGMDMYEDEK